MSFRFSRWLCCGFVLSCLLAALEQACALEPHTPLAQYARQSWSVENGLPQNTIPVLFQGEDGYLQAGTETAVAQFDGIAFRLLDHALEPAFPDAEIRALLEDKASGDRWIGTSDGLVWLHQGVLRRFTQQDGLPANGVRALLHATDGTVWIATDGGLAHWANGSMSAVALPGVLRGAGITSIAAGGDGRLWVGTEHGAAAWGQGQWEAGGVSSRHRAGNAYVAADGKGGVLLCDAGGVALIRGDQQAAVVVPREDLPADAIVFAARVNAESYAVASRSELVVVRRGNDVGRFAAGRQLPGSHIQSVLADREGSLWVGTNRGLARLTVQGGAVRFPAGDVLAGASVLSLLEDHEGDLWVGTETDGLHVLRDARFHALGSADGLSSDHATAVVEDSAHTLWVGTRDAGLNRISAAQTTALTTANGLASNVILSLAAAQDGSLWVGTPDGLNHVSARSTATYTSSDGLPDDFIRSLLVDADGSLWVGTRHGLTHLAHGRFQSWDQSQGLGSDLVGAMAQEPDGDLWIATLHGLTRLQHGALHTYTTADGLSSDVITALAFDKGGRLWIGTQNAGLSLWEKQRFVALNSRANPLSNVVPAAVHTLLFDAAGELWISSSNGLTRVDPEVVVACAADAHCRLSDSSFVSFGTADGLRSRETSSNSHPTALKTASGMLWFSTPRGVVSAEPQRFPAYAGPPPVHVERFAVDDKEESLFREKPLPAGHSHFQFDYAAVSLAVPYKVRYQYTLEGFDHGWTDAGTRRTAYYTNIPPGNYRFRVRAARDDAGALAFSNGSEAMVSDTALAFTLEPHYYQTVWFRVLASVLVIALVLLLVRNRVLRAERGFSAVMAERNRIAREIHDTLAQGYVGISLQLEVLGQLLRMNKSDAAMKHLETTQELVRVGLNDARQSIWALRSQDASESTLPVRLRRMVEEAKDASIDTAFAAHGIYKPLDANLEQELLRIAQEAIANVKHHAQASHLEVTLDYGRDWVRLTISDDGRGFAPVVAARAGEPVRAQGREKGHYGLIGMQERAALLRGEFAIDTEPGRGTTIRLRVKTAPGEPDSIAPAVS